LRVGITYLAGRGRPQIRGKGKPLATSGEAKGFHKEVHKVNLEDTYMKLTPLTFP